MAQLTISLLRYIVRPQTIFKNDFKQILFLQKKHKVCASLRKLGCVCGDFKQRSGTRIGEKGTQEG